MKIIKINEVNKFEKFEAENLQFLELFRSKHISISLDKYIIGIKTPMLYKNRPDGGKEILIPLQGEINIITEKATHSFKPETEGISIVILDPNTKRQFENVGETDAKVLAIFAPPFQLNEIKDFLQSVDNKES